MTRSRLIDSLRVPILGAPMAGGPSTPALAAAVSEAGGLGFLAAGYRTAEQMSDQLDEAARLTARPIGMNVFVPELVGVDPAEVAAYRAALKPWARRAGVPLPPLPDIDLDADLSEAAAIVELAASRGVPIVTFTFGLPEEAWVERLRSAGCEVGITVSGPDEAVRARALDPDVLIVQGPEAGGHRGTLAQHAAGDERPVGDLVASVRSGIGRDADAPALVASGGVATREHAVALLGTADAVQVGTALLLAPESGTREEHRAALRDGERFGTTAVTRVFSGRRARALVNRAVRELTAAEITAYPHVHHLTSPLRRASSDPEDLNLWAGTGHRQIREQSAAATIGALAP